MSPISSLKSHPQGYAASIAGQGFDDVDQVMQAAWEKYINKNLLSDTDEDAEETFKDAFVVVSRIVLSFESWLPSVVLYTGS